MALAFLRVLLTRSGVPELWWQLDSSTICSCLMLLHVHVHVHVINVVSLHVLACGRFITPQYSTVQILESGSVGQGRQ